MRKRAFLPLAILVVFSMVITLVLNAVFGIPPQHQVLDEKTGAPSAYALNITNAEAIGLDAVDEWLEERTEGAGFQWLMYTDPDSWDAFIYIPEIQQRTGDLTNADVTIKVTEDEPGRTLNVYLHTENVTTHEKPPQEQVIHLAAPMRGAWPTAVCVYVDGVELPCDDMEFNI